MQRGIRSHFSRGAAALSLAVVFVAGATTACGTEGGSGSAVTLNIYQLNANKAGQEVVNANFEKAHPDIEINMTYIESMLTDGVQQILPGLQAGNAPDAWATTPANGSPVGVWPLAEAGRLMDLSDRPWAEKVPDVLRSSVSRDGKVYGVPTSVTVNSILYNVAVWDELELAAPETLSELLTMCRKVDAAGKRMFAVNVNGGGITGSVPLAILLMNEYVYAVDPEWSEKRDSGEEKFATSPLWRDAYQALIDMKDANCFIEAAEGASSAEAQAEVVTGRAVAFLTSGSAIAGIQELKPDLELRMAALPAKSAENTVAPLSTAVMVVNGASKHPEQIREFIDFMAQEDQLTEFAGANNFIAPYDVDKGALPDYLESLRPYFDDGRLVSDTHYSLRNPSIFAEVLVGYIPGIMSGQVTVDKLLKDADYLWDNPNATAAR